MKSKRLLLITASLLLCSSAVWAQMGLGKPKDIEVVKSQPLIVVLKDEDPKELKKLADKPDDLSAYKGYIANYNAQVQELVPKLWKFSPSIEFRPASALPALRKAKGGRYGVLQQADLIDTHRHYNSAGGAPGGMSNMLNYSYSSEHVSAFTLEVYGSGDQDKVWRVSIAPGPIYASDIIFSLRTMQTYMQSRLDGRSGGDMRAEVAANGKKLPKKVLLIDETDLKDKLTAADLKAAYPLPYEVVPRQTIEQAVASGDARYAYIRMMPVTESIFAQVVVDAATNDLLAYSLPGTMQMMALRSGGSVVSKASLKDFAKAASK
jgi:hypothetical protein